MTEEKKRKGDSPRRFRRLRRLSMDWLLTTQPDLR